MKVFYCLLSATVTIGLITLLNVQLPLGGSKTPRLGYFLSPQKGFWQNAESTDETFDGKVLNENLQANAEVYFDERLVPHVYAQNEHDAFFIQGYLHAKFRLWQMEFETDAAAGRLSEIMGDSANGINFLSIDKYFRRLGMRYGAENSLAVIEADTMMKAVCDAYTAGVNAYINTLDESTYPLEFKLLDYKPEPWTNFRTAVFMKYMALDLAGFERDFEMTNAKSVFTKAEFNALFPYQEDSLDPIVPRGTLFPKADGSLKPPASADSLYFNYKRTIEPADTVIKPNPNNGSNNWAVAGSRTASGKPILCNDPHLNLNLPSVWYEMHISTPEFNVYGASFPGAPTVVIGFNDSCAWGVTNAERDVRDYYEIKFRDSTMQEYWFNGAWQKTTFRDEVIKIRGKTSDTEHIAMTVWGPVMYDKTYPDKLHTDKAYAVKWSAHEGSDEVETFYKMDKSKNYSDYLSAISSLHCPGQNIIFASKNGDIALRQQGKFPAKWKGQGDFIMPGDDSSYAWHGNIPDSANITMHNPERGFVSSANQYPYDTTYPYYLGGVYPLYRGIIINRMLSQMQGTTTDDMEKMQTSNYNVFAEMARPVLLKYLKENEIADSARKYLDTFKNWDLENNPDADGATIFDLWWDSLSSVVYDDEFFQSNLPMPKPEMSTLLEGIRKDSAYQFADNINTPKKEDVATDVTTAFEKIIPVLQTFDKQNELEWSKYKSSGIMHLLRIPALSRLNLYSGGGLTEINAYEKFHGPSWRMVVELTDQTKAYGIYPGGQSGNPGSKYYDAFIDDWLTGKYYELLFSGKEELQRQTNLKGLITFSK